MMGGFFVVVVVVVLHWVSLPGKLANRLLTG